MLASLEKTMGVVSHAANLAKIKRQKHYRWIKEDKDYRESVEELDLFALDFAESKLFTKIKEGDTTSIIFYLKTKGRVRGYGQNEMQTVTKVLVPTKWVDELEEEKGT